MKLAKAQMAMEYLMVIGFSLLLIIPIITLVYQHYDENRTSIHQEHLQELARELKYQAEKIHYQGAPSRTTVEASLPPGVKEVIIVNKTIEFRMENNDVSIYADTRVNVTGNIKTFSGPHIITLQAYDNGNLDPEDDYVNITG